MSAPGIFVTGTDTGVGKTVLAAGLLCAARARGMDAVPMKPVQTGALRSRPRDLRFCLDRAGLRPPRAALRTMCPVCLRLAASPHLAARSERTSITVDGLFDAFLRLRMAHDCVLVEGAGGVCVPLNDGDTMLDLMRTFALPVVLASRPSLGTLNHTLLSLAVLRGAGLNVRGVVLVDASPRRWGRIERDNARTLERLGALPVARLPHVPDLRRDFPTIGKVCAKISNDWKLFG